MDQVLFVVPIRKIVSIIKIIENFDVDSQDRKNTLNYRYLCSESQTVSSKLLKMISYSEDHIFASN